MKVYETFKALTRSLNSVNGIPKDEAPYTLIYGTPSILVTAKEQAFEWKRSYENYVVEWAWVRAVFTQRELFSET